MISLALIWSALKPCSCTRHEPAIRPFFSSWSVRDWRGVSVRQTPLQSLTNQEEKKGLIAGYSRHQLLALGWLRDDVSVSPGSHWIQGLALLDDATWKWQQVRLVQIPIDHAFNASCHGAFDNAIWTRQWRRQDAWVNELTNETHDEMNEDAAGLRDCWSSSAIRDTRALSLPSCTSGREKERGTGRSRDHWRTVLSSTCTRVNAHSNTREVRTRR